MNMQTPDKRRRLTHEEHFNLVLWLNRQPDLLTAHYDNLADRAEKELKFVVSPKSIWSITRAQRTKARLARMEAAEKEKIARIRERAEAAKEREARSKEPNTQVAILARAIMRLYSGLGSQVPVEVEKIAYKD